MISSALAIFLVSLLAFPMTYVTNAAQSLHGELGLFVTGVICLSLVCYLVYLALAAAPGTKDGSDGSGGGGGGSHDWLLYVFTLGTFASVVDLIIGLETDGFVKGFMSVYLRNGEPYLGTPYGALISYWDGTAHYAMYLYMLAAMTYKWNYRRVGLYWAGSIGHSMLILIPGAILGQYGVRWSFLLNVPYIFIPFMSAARFLKDGQRERQKKSITDAPAINQSVMVVSDSSSIWLRPVDLSLCLLLVTSIAICLHRGFAVLGCRHEIATTYLDFYEPYLKDPSVFPKIQMLVYLFYFVPFYIAALHALLHRGCAWLPDWSILFAGASAQAQIPHILGSLHPRTWPDFQVPGHESAQIVFWTVNLLLLVTPHLLALRCWMRPRRFNPQSPPADGSQLGASDANRKNS